MSRSSEVALSDLTIGGDNSSGAFAPAVQVAATRGAFFRKPGVTKADVVNDIQDISVSGVSTALVGEASTARAAELSLATRTSVETAARVSGDLSLTTAVSAEASTARSAELVLTNAVSTEAADRTAAVSTALVSANTYTDGKIADLVNGAPGLLDTLKELADALGGDQNFATTILGKFGDVSVALSNEVIRAVSVETVLSSSLSTEVVDRTAAVSTEASIARSAELSLQVRFSTEVAAEATTSRSAELSLGTSVSAEATRAISAELSLSTRVAAENAARISGDLSLTTALTAEASVSRSAELSLTTRASTETAARVSADLSLTTSVSDETVARISGDLSLTTALTAEASIARSAELSLTTRVSLEEVTRASTLAAAISTEVIDRNAAISTQASVTLAGAYQYTDGAISTEVINRNAAVSVALASANSYTDGAVSSLSTAVANNISTVVLNTSTNLSNAISTEVVDRNAAISTSVSNLSTAVSIALAAEESTARSAELSLANLISAQTSTTTSNLSAALSTNTANRITYQTAATTKFSAIQQAFDIIFDAIDLEKYQGSAPDYFQYDETVQDLTAPPVVPTVEMMNVSRATISLVNDASSQVYKTMTDSSGNLYSVGTYLGTSTRIEEVYSGSLISVNNLDGSISSYTLPRLTPGNFDGIFLIKYNSSGLVQWCTGYDSIDGDSVFGIELDSNNNVYICGRTNPTNVPAKRISSASGFSQVLSNVTLPNSASFTIGYLIKYNSAGVAQWATFVDGIHNSGHFDVGYGVKVDSSDNLYMIGQYRTSSAIALKSASGNTQVDSSITLPITTGAAGYLIKYNSSGAVQWATNVDGSGNDLSLALEIDSNDNIYTTGNYFSTTAITLKNASGNTQINSLYTLPISSGSLSCFLIKYNSSGIVQWANRFVSGTSSFPNKIGIDNSDNILLTGYYQSSGSVTLQNVSGITQVASTYTLPATTLRAAFLIKYNSSGIVQWSTNINGEFQDSSNDISIDGNGYIFITGALENNTTTHNPTVINNANGTSQIASSITLPSFSGAGIPATFLVKYNSSGVAKSAVQIHGASGFAVCNAGNDIVYLGGSIVTSSTVTLTNAEDATQVNSAFTLPSTSGVARSFLVKYTYNNL
jgi:hypothetical protein